MKTRSNPRFLLGPLAAASRPNFHYITFWQICQAISQKFHKKIFFPKL